MSGQFMHGYLIAVSNLINGHGATDYAEYLLRDLGATIEQVKALDLCEYDADAILPLMEQITAKAKGESSKADSQGER